MKSFVECVTDVAEKAVFQPRPSLRGASSPGRGVVARCGSGKFYVTHHFRVRSYDRLIDHTSQLDEERPVFAAARMDVGLFVELEVLCEGRDHPRLEFGQQGSLPLLYVWRARLFAGLRPRGRRAGH